MNLLMYCVVGGGICDSALCAVNYAMCLLLVATNSLGREHSYVYTSIARAPIQYSG